MAGEVVADEDAVPVVPDVGTVRVTITSAAAGVSATRPVSATGRVAGAGSIRRSRARSASS